MPELSYCVLYDFFLVVILLESELLLLVIIKVLLLDRSFTLGMNI